MAQRAGQMEVVSRVPAGRDAHPLPVDVPDLPQRRWGRDEIRALDEHVGSGEGEVCRTRGVDGQKADIAGAGLEGGEGLSGGVERDQVDGQAETPAEFAGEIDRDSARLAGGRIALGEHRVAEVDGGAQAPGRRELLGDGRWRGLHERSPVPVDLWEEGRSSALFGIPIKPRTRTEPEAPVPATRVARSSE